MQICIGDILEKFISIITFGKGKIIALKVASYFGYIDCGCNKRIEYLNRLGGCRKGIKLN